MLSSNYWSVHMLMVIKQFKIKRVRTQKKIASIRHVH